MALCLDGDISDEEIFLGKLTLKEIKKRIIPDQQRRTISCVNNKDEVNNSAESIKIIESHSEPEMNSEDAITSISNIKSVTRRECTKSMNMTNNLSDESIDESFLKLEKAVNELSMSPNANNHFNDTVEVVHLVLNNVPLKIIKNVEIENFKSSNEEILTNKDIDIAQEADDENNLSNVCTRSVDESHETPIAIKNLTPNHKINNKSSITLIKEKIQPQNSVTDKIRNNEPAESHMDRHYKTPSKREDKTNESFNNELLLKNNLLQPPVQEFLSTPSSRTKNIQHSFKTPKNVASVKKNASSAKKSPGTTYSYQHVMSPVAHYIKHSPQVPLIRNVHPKKPLPGGTSIPRLMNNEFENKTNNKENVLLPSIAYRNAKKTKVITVSEKKMPQNQWAKKLISSTPVVRKHINKAVAHTKTPLATQQEDSFANLSLIEQADISIHVEKSAFKP